MYSLIIINITHWFRPAGSNRAAQPHLLNIL